MTAALWTAAAIGLLLRLAFGLGYWIDKPLTQDEREYLSLARSLSAGRGFTYDAAVLDAPVEPVGRAPGYPAFLALVGGGRRPVEHVPAAVKAAQSIVGAIGVLLVAAIARRLAGPRAAAAAAFVAACYPPLVWISAYALSEVLVWPIGLVLVWLFDRAGAPPGEPRLRWAVCGAWAGLAALVHPALVFFVPIAAAFLLWRRLWTAAPLFVLGAALAIAPWTVRNLREHGRFELIASEGGVTFWTGNNALARGEGDLAANPALGLEKQALRARYGNLPADRMEPVYYREALAWMAAHPIAWLVLEARKAFYLFVPAGPSYRLHSARYYWLSVVSYGLLLPVGLLGLRRLRLRFREAPGLWLLACASIAAALVFFPQERFRLPVIDPALVICAGAAIGAPYERSPTTA
jgi:4-amino-4-deoxy-L-arabinose transferase-like glycosyltransferase